MTEIVHALTDGMVRYLAIGSVATLVLVLLALAFLKAGRIRTPVYRHMIWLYCLMGIMGLPMIWLYGPKLTLAILPASAQTYEASASPGAGPHDNEFPPDASQTPPRNLTAEISSAYQAPILSWKTAAVAVWFLGFSIMLFRLIVGWVRLRRICRSAIPLPSHEYPVGLADPRLRLCLTSRLQGPVCFGMFRPVILLPQDLVHAGNREDLRMVLTHELAHVERRDCWANLFQRIVEAMYFFHPLVWLASRQLTQEREEICDNHVLAEGVSADDYTTLLSQLGTQAVNAGYLQTVALFEGQLLSRIRSLLDPSRSRQTRLPWRVAAVCTVAVLAGFLVFGCVRLAARSGDHATGAVPESSPPSSVSVEQKSPSPLNQPAVDSQRLEQPHYAARTFNSKAVFDVSVQESYAGIPRPIGHTPSAAPIEIPVCYFWVVQPPVPVKDWDLLIREMSQNSVPALSLTQATDADLKRLAGIRGLQFLELSNTSITDAGLVHIQGLTGLWGLDLVNTRITDSGLAHLKGLTRLQRLRLGGTQITDASLAYLKNLTGLQVLWLDGTQITDAGLAHLKGLTGLQWLILYNTQITDAGLEHLKDLTGLQWLLLGGTQITDAGLAHIEGLTGLQMLGIAGTQITDAGLVHLRGLTGLQEIRLSDTQITDAGLVHLKGLTGLQRLKLGNTQITDAGLEHLKGLTRLQELQVDNTQVTAAGLEQLKGLTGLKGLGSDLLNRAAATGDIERVKSQLAQGTDANGKDRNGSTPLHEAAANGRRDVVQLLLGKGANIEAADASGRTPLHRAATFGGKYVPALLLAKGANINARDNQGNTPLHAAMERQEVDTSFLEFLLAKGAEANARNEQGETPLHLVARIRGESGKAELAARALLAHGAEVDATDKSGRTPLHVAAQSGQTKVVELLLAKGAAVDKKTKDGLLALHSAVMAGHKEIVALLLAKRANVNTAQPSGETPLHDAAKAGYNEIAELLIAKGADVNAKNPRGETPAQVALAQDPPGTVRLLLARGGEVSTIQLAAYAGDLAKVKGYIDKGISVNAQDENGLTPLHAAAATREKEVVEYLIAAGASVNAASAADGLGTPLHYAAHGGSKYVADFLVLKGTPVDARNSKGETPLHLAAQMGHMEVCRRLITSKASVNLKARNDDEWTPLHYAAAYGQNDTATLLIEKGADIDASAQGSTPLEVAAERKHKEVVKLLVDKGADVSASSTDLLYYAAWHGYKELAEACIKKGANVNSKAWGDAVALYVFYDDSTNSWGNVLELLLAHGADPNAKDNTDWSLLHYAVYEDISLVRMLLDKGANPNVIDVRGKSPLHYAAEEGRRPAVELLIAHRADPKVKDYDGRTPLSLAKEKGHNEIVDLLRQHGAKE